MELDTLQKYLTDKASEIDRRLGSFTASANLFSSNHPRLIDQYENKWVAAYNGAIAAVGESLADVVKQVEARGIPRKETMIRHIDREEKTLIL